MHMTKEKQALLEQQKSKPNVEEVQAQADITKDALIKIEQLVQANETLMKSNTQLAQ